MVQPCLAAGEIGRSAAGRTGCAGGAGPDAAGQAAHPPAADAGRRALRGGVRHGPGGGLDRPARGRRGGGRCLPPSGCRPLPGAGTGRLSPQDPNPARPRRLQQAQQHPGAGRDEHVAGRQGLSCRQCRGDQQCHRRRGRPRGPQPRARQQPDQAAVEERGKAHAVQPARDGVAQHGLERQPVRRGGLRTRGDPCGDQPRHRNGQRQAAPAHEQRPDRECGDGAGDVGDLDGGTDGHDAPALGGADRQRKQQPDAAATVGRVEQRGHQQPGHRGVRDGRGAEAVAGQQRPQRVPVFVQIDGWHVGRQPLAAPGDQQQRGERCREELAQQGPARRRADDCRDQRSGGGADRVGVQVTHGAGALNEMHLGQFDSCAERDAEQQGDACARCQRHARRQGEHAKEAERHVEQDVGDQVAALVPVLPGAEQMGEGTRSGGVLPFERVERAVQHEQDGEQPDQRIRARRQSGHGWSPSNLRTRRSHSASSGPPAGTIPARSYQ